jgi:hypothetical protein
MFLCAVHWSAVSLADVVAVYLYMNMEYNIYGHPPRCAQEPWNVDSGLMGRNCQEPGQLTATHRVEQDDGGENVGDSATQSLMFQK